MSNTNLKSKLLFSFLIISSILHAQSPNVIVIIADDLGWSQVSTGLTNLNNPSDFYETPTIETLASEGIAFPHAYVNGANCAPTRAAILSGQYAARPTNNIFNVSNLNRGNNSTNSTLIGPDMGLPSGKDEIPTTAITIAESMKTAGYVTVHLGKYHVGENESTDVSNNAPTDQGFDYNYGGGTSGAPGNYFATNSAPYTFSSNIGPEFDQYASPYTATESMSLAGDNSLTGTAKHITDAMADAAIDFMEAEKNNPFFMHFSNYAVHGPFSQAHARPDLYAKYAAKTPSTMGHNNLGQAAIAEGMDQTIGRLIDYLKTTDDPRIPGQKLSENTLVYFISDNGGAIDTDDNGPLREMKGSYYEGGIRSVTLAWSEASWLANKGSVNNTPIVAFDLYPTLVEMAGGTLPVGYDIDGESQWQMLSNGSSMTRETIFWHFPGYLIDGNRNQRPVTIVRKGDYKLIHNYESVSYELYHLINDISEANNLLSSSDPAMIILANDMITDMRNHLISTSAPLPTYRSDGTTVSLPDFINTPNPNDGCQAVSGYSAYWNFDSASQANDVSGNGNNPISINGSLTYDNSDFKEGDQSVIFDGTVDINYSSSTFMSPSMTARTVSAWIKPTSLTGIQEILDEGGNGKGIAIRLNGTNLESVIRNSSSVGDNLSIPFPNDGDWHHVALVYDGANTSQTIYIDGIQAANSNSAPNSIGSHNVTGGGIAGVIGNYDSFGDGADNYFIGKMDAFAIYNIALSPAQIETSACYTTQVIANAGSDVSICEGSPTTLTATGGTDYVWNTGATTASISVSPNVTTTYTVTVSDGTTSDNDDVIVTVNTVPVANAGSDVSINEGESATLTASGGEDYLWSNGATSPSITVSPNMTTTYSVIVSQNGCSSTDNVLVTVNPIVGCTYSVINSEGFESSWGIWNDGGSDSHRNANSTYATSGVYSMRLRDNTSTSVGTTDYMDLSSYEEITVSFGYYCRSMDNSSEDFWLQISTDGGNSFTTKEEWNRDDEFVNDQFYTDQVIIPGPFTSNTQIRFRADASGNQDWVYIDDIVISGCSTQSNLNPAIVPLENYESITTPAINIDGTKNIIYPNPFIDNLNIKVIDEYMNIEFRMFNTTGQLVLSKNFKNNQNIILPTQDLPLGQYIIKLNIDGIISSKLVIKM